MQLSQFEKSISTKILARGKSYFKDDVVTITYLKEQKCTADVAGTYNYEVIIEWQDDLITYTDCDCPDEYNDPCKHVVATLFALRIAQKKTKAPVALKQQLEALSKKQLIQLLDTIAKENFSMMKSIQNQLNPGTHVLTEAREKIRHHFSKAKGRYNFIPYDMMDEALEGVQTVLVDVEHHISNGELLIATQLVLLCYEEIIVLEDYDDSTDEIPGVLAAAQNILSQILEQQPTQAIFDEMATLLVDGFWDHFEDDRIELLKMLEPWAKLFSDDFRQLLQQLLTVCQRHAYKELLLDFQYDFILQTNDEKLLQPFFDTYSHFSTVRKKAIYRAIDQQEIQKAIRLTLEAINKDRDNTRLLKDWQRMLYSLHEMQDNKKEMEKLAIALLLAGEQEFYNELQYIAADWLTTQEAVLNQLAQKNPVVYTNLLVEHHLSARLLQYCEQTPNAIFHFAGELPMHGQEVITLYQDSILRLVSNSTARSHYQQIATHLKNFKSYGYIEETETLKQQLLTLYPRKKALIAELDYV